MSLYDFQETAVEALRDNIRAGVTNQVLCAPTGSGKTEMAMHLIEECNAKRKRAVFVVDRISLLDQTSARFDAHGIQHGVIQAQHWRFRPWNRIQVASVQTVARRNWPDADLIIVDECFPAGTPIATPDGPIDISQLRRGHTVYCATGQGVIDCVFTKQSALLVEVQLSDGRRIRCTPGHPFFTGGGWVIAAALEPGQDLFGVEAVRGLWGDVLSTSLQEGFGRRGAGVHAQEDVFAGLRESLAVEAEVFQRTHEALEPNEEPRDTAACIAHAAGDWAPTPDSRWQRSPDAEGSGGAFEGPWAGVERGIHRAHRAAQEGWAAVPLQDRHSAPFNDGRDRGGWLQPHDATTSGTRRPEGCMVAGARVVRVSYIQCPGRVPVYNLHVGGHPSFFAGGVLVHNCHSMHQTTLERIKHRDTTTIGLSATPFSRGLGKHYDRVVCSATTQKLIEDGYLAPFKIFAASEPDMEGAKTVAGEWSDDEAAKRSMPIVGDCVAEYLKHGNNGKAIAFGCTVAHCEELQRQFLAAGVQTGLYTYRTGDEERTRMLEEYRKPDSYIRVLISVAALARGFDVPDVRVVILARPLKKSLAEHVQMLGRGLRKDPDDPDKTCIVLDHAGNSVRFWDAMTTFFEDGISELDMGTHRAKKKAKDKAAEPRKCPKCKHVHSPRPTCPACGHAYPRKVVRHEAGELAELGNGADGALVRQRFYGELIFVARQRGYKDGWAAHKYRERYQRWPNGLPDTPVTPSLETLNWIKSRQIAWARSKKKKWAQGFAQL